jgi:hypothetical protein
MTMKNVMFIVMMLCSLGYRSYCSYELLLLQSNLDELSTRSTSARTKVQKLQFSEEISTRSMPKQARSLKGRALLSSEDPSIDWPLRAMGSIIRSHNLDKIPILKFFKDDLLKCDTEQKLVAYFLKNVEIYDPVTDKKTRINPKSRKDYKAGDLYMLDPLFGDALSESGQFEEFSPRAQNEIRAFNAAIDKLWPIVQKLRKDAGFKI